MCSSHIWTNIKRHFHHHQHFRPPHILSTISGIILVVLDLNIIQEHCRTDGAPPTSIEGGAARRFLPSSLLTSVARRRPNKQHRGAQLGAPSGWTLTHLGTLAISADQVILMTSGQWHFGVIWAAGGETGPTVAWWVNLSLENQNHLHQMIFHQQVFSFLIPLKILFSVEVQLRSKMASDRSR